MLMEMRTEFIFGIWVKMMQLTSWMVLTWLIKGAFYKFFLLYIKMGESAYLTYYQEHWDVILNRAKDNYENDKERLREHPRDKYRNLSEEKNKKEKMGKIDIIMSEENKIRLKEYQKNYRKAKKISI